MTKYIWITILVIALILILGYKQAPNEPSVAPHGSAMEGVPEDAIPQLDEGEPSVSESGNIKVTRPQPNNTITSPLLIKGEARVFDGKFQMRLKDAEGNVIVEKSGTAQAEEAPEGDASASKAGGGEFGTFGELLLFDKVESKTGVLEVYSIDAKDGAEINLVSIPVKF